MIDKLGERLAQWVREDPGNRIGREQALSEECVGLVLYDRPVLGVAAADDPYFLTLGDPAGANVKILPPGEWLAGARSVISCFFPYSAQVRDSNRAQGEPSLQWLHARIEGQALLVRACVFLRDLLTEIGYKAVLPAGDERFETANFTSNWSERHVAFAAGLGTFGLSRGLITGRGMAGRFGSVVTTAPFPVTPRRYTRYDERCTMCLACAKRCPAGAIDPNTGKDHQTCSAYMNVISARHKDRYYGCGKCQVGVPCESGVPKGARREAI